jgi:hypothetical protein
MATGRGGPEKGLAEEFAEQMYPALRNYWAGLGGGETNREVGEGILDSVKLGHTEIRHLDHEGGGWDQGKLQGKRGKTLIRILMERYPETTIHPREQAVAEPEEESVGEQEEEEARQGARLPTRRRKRRARTGEWGAMVQRVTAYDPTTGLYTMLMKTGGIRGWTGMTPNEQSNALLSAEGILMERGGEAAAGWEATQPMLTEQGWWIRVAKIEKAKNRAKVEILGERKFGTGGSF